MIKRFNWATTFVLLALIIWDVPINASFAAEPRAQGPKQVSDEIIVRFRNGTDEAQKDQARFRVAGRLKKVFQKLPGLEVIKLPPNVSVHDAIEQYQQDPQVLYAEPNYILHLNAKASVTATPNDPSFGSLYGLTKIGAPTAWNSTTGSSSVVVAILDTGFDYNHPDLAANIFNNPGECTPNGVDDDGDGYADDCHGIDVANGDSDPMDDNDHGTHVAGTIGAVGNNGIGVVGVNWTVKMLSCKFFDASGSGTTEGAIECLQYVKALKDRGVNIVATSNSWGGGDFSQALYDAIDDQRESGILFITAAGNGNIFGVGQNNDNAPFYPCTYFLPNIICVAATTNTDARASFSNYGKHTVHVGAPGNNILSTLPGNSYGSLSGTSMATPHVSGAAALLKAQDPNRDWRTIKNLILAGGDTVSSMANTVTGKRINVNGAMTCSNKIIQARLEPIASSISSSPGVPVFLAFQNINCAAPNGNVQVSVSPGSASVTLLDDGAGADQAAADGIYSGQWTPDTAGTYTLTFPGNDKVTVTVANPTINVTPSSVDFGGVAVNGSVDKTITVKNTGGGILAGTATTNAPYSIVSGETYSLSNGQSQTVTVRFAPTSTGSFAGNVTFSGGTGASVTVSGFTTSVNSITPNPIDLVAPPSGFTLSGNGFANLGFGLPAANFMLNGTLVGQVRATSVSNNTLAIPFPGTQGIFANTLPGLSAGTITVQIYNQTGSGTWGLVGSTSLTVNDSRIAN
jgi:Subtilase family/Fervidolysin N-terminal prodomain/HYDIN/CFA65/VesB-like, Ig-like domain